MQTSSTESSSWRARREAAGRGCLSEELLLAFAAGQLQGEAHERADRHVDICTACQVLLALAAQALEGVQQPELRGDLHVLAPGTLLSGRYKVTRFVARGGMGEVYEAKDQALDERIAVKTLGARTLDGPKAILRLRSEVQLARRVSHPHACRVHDLGTHRPADARSLPIHFLTMEYVDGHTLSAELRARGKLPPHDVRALALQLIDGLAAAHRVGILHRDFKSDNVMLRARPAGQAEIDAVIMDFGLARVVRPGSARLTSYAHAFLGSAAYMAPEQVEGAELSEASDLYAFGVVLFELLTGQLPFVASAPIATALQRLHRAPPPPSRLVPEIGPRWDALVLGCLERRVEQRLASADELRAALIALGSPSSPREKPGQPRKLWLAGLAGIGVGAPLGMAAAALMFCSRASTITPQRDPALTSQGGDTPALPALHGDAVPQSPTRVPGEPRVPPAEPAPTPGGEAPSDVPVAITPRARPAHRPSTQPAAATSYRPSEDPVEGFLEPDTAPGK